MTTPVLVAASPAMEVDEEAHTVPARFIGPLRERDTRVLPQPRDVGLFIGPLRRSDELRVRFGDDMPSIGSPLVVELVLCQMDEEAAAVAAVGLWDRDKNAYAGTPGTPAEQARAAWATYTAAMMWWASRYNAGATMVSAGTAARHLARRFGGPTTAAAAERLVKAARAFATVFAREERKYPDDVNGGGGDDDNDKRAQDFEYSVRRAAGNANPGEMALDWAEMPLDGMCKPVLASARAIRTAAWTVHRAYHAFEALVA